MKISEKILFLKKGYTKEEIKAMEDAEKAERAKEQETVPDDMPDFSQCLVLYLAAAICGCVSGDEDKRQELLSRAEMVLREAMLVDATQDASNDQHPLERLLNNSITA